MKTDSNLLNRVITSGDQSEFLNISDPSLKSSLKCNEKISLINLPRTVTIFSALIDRDSEETAMTFWFSFLSISIGFVAKKQKKSKKISGK